LEDEAMPRTCRAAVRVLVSPFLGVALLALALAGCGGKGDVTGKVSLEGKPLVFGTVQFEGSDGRLRQANIQPDGSYTVSGVTTGEAKVAVSSQNPNSSDFKPLIREGGKAPPPRPEVKGWFPIPKKYDAPFTSGLKYPIRSGQNKIDIELKE
jgi:hypothetical protein